MRTVPKARELGCPHIRRDTDWKCPNWPGNPTHEALPPSSTVRHHHFAGSAYPASQSGPGDTYTKGCFLNYFPFLVRSLFFFFFNRVPTTESQNFLRSNQEQWLVLHNPSDAPRAPISSSLWFVSEKAPIFPCGLLGSMVISHPEPPGEQNQRRHSHAPRGPGPRDQRSAGNYSV